MALRHVLDQVRRMESDGIVAARRPRRRRESLSFTPEPGLTQVIEDFRDLLAARESAA